MAFVIAALSVYQPTHTGRANLVCLLHPSSHGDVPGHAEYTLFPATAVEFGSRLLLFAPVQFHIPHHDLPMTLVSGL